jgi:3-oxoacyl-(acyl-carrier-protein) synthase
MNLLHEAAWSERGQIGYFLGVGASGGSPGDITGLLERGVAACNPLLAFQLMNNFAMCHGAILEGVGGPNAALFSRGAGTIAAIGEAVHAIRSGDCDHAVAGGADEATHPVTIAELTRDGFIARGLAPADGAALVAMAVARGDDAVLVEGCAHVSGRGRSIGDALTQAGAPTDVTDVVIAPWGAPAADALRSFIAARFPDATVLDTAPLGESLAASAALAVCAAVDLLTTRPGRVVVLTLGVDGDPGAVVLSRGAA